MAAPSPISVRWWEMPAFPPATTSPTKTSALWPSSWEPPRIFSTALPESLEEKQILCSTEIYRQIHEEWERIDTALVNIGDYPSSPDFASLVRYGGLLQEHHACGRMLVYYFNEDGTVIQSDQDFAIQVPLETLKQCPNIIGVCSANTSAKAVKGALKSGILTHIVARSSLIHSILEK